MRIFQLVKNVFVYISEVRITTSIMESNARPGGQRGGGRGRGGFSGRGSSRARGGRKQEMGRQEFKSVGLL